MGDASAPDTSPAARAVSSLAARLREAGRPRSKRDLALRIAEVMAERNFSLAEAASVVDAELFPPAVNPVADPEIGAVRILHEDVVRLLGFEEEDLLATASRPLVAALPVRRAPGGRKTADYHNHLLALGYRRADQLEAKLAAVLRPILDRAGEEAARAFEAKATDFLTAAGDPAQVAEARSIVAEEQDALRRALAAGNEPSIELAKQRVKDAQAKLLEAVKGPQWASPAPDELLDVDALVETLRTKVDPIRQATIQASANPLLQNAGLSWDVSQPLIANALIGSGKQIKSIAETTQRNVGKIIGASIEEGLSVPDTSAAIRIGMKEASATRATLIARTEIAGAVHAGSLAATQIVAQSSGEKFEKRWMTAPGAVYPRHETYEGLDGQVQPLDGAFAVGDSELQFPGDPSGDVSEVANCRCTLSYDTAEGQQEADAENLPDLPET